VGGALSYMGKNQMGVYEATPVSTEMQTREWFVAHIGQFDYDIVKSQGPFPDYVLRDKFGTMVRCEIEYESKNFIAHQHDPRDCDLIVCWIHNANLPLSVLELSTKKLYRASFMPRRIPNHQKFLQSLAIVGSPVTSFDYACARLKRAKRQGLRGLPEILV